MTIGRRLISVCAMGALAAVWFATSASAHVTVAAPGVTVGSSDATINFRVPDESDTASTVSLRLQLPTNTPLAGVLVAPIEGWTSKITQTKLATPIHTDDGDITEVVSEIDWTATSGGVKPGYFGQFPIIAGKLPDKATSLTFRAIQTYSDGKVVSWNQVAAPGSTEEPDFPAPVLNLTTNAEPPASAGSSSAAPASRSIVTAKTDAASKSAATVGIVVGAAGLLLGAIALALVLLGRRRSAST